MQLRGCNIALNNPHCDNITQDSKQRLVSVWRLHGGKVRRLSALSRVAVLVLVGSRGGEAAADVGRLWPIALPCAAMPVTHMQA